MKTILFLALATALLGEPAKSAIQSIENIEKSINEIDRLTKKMLADQKSEPHVVSTAPSSASSLFIKTEEKLTTGGITIQTQPTNEVFTIAGIPQVQFGTGSGLFQYPQFRRPKDAAEVIVHVWTADGRKWVAKWEETK